MSFDGTTPAAPAPYYADVADGPEGGAAYWLTTGDGVQIRAGLWPAAGAAPKGTILVFPGRTEYIEKYGRDACDLTAAGYAVLTVDWRGQGIAGRLLADRAVGHVDRFTDYQHDVAALCAFAEAEGLPKPWFLLAHSMGGCIGLRALMEGLPVNAVTFSAPMWGIQMKTALRPIAWGLSTLSRPLRFSHRFAPGQHPIPYALSTEFEENRLTSDADMFAHICHQLRTHPDLALGGPSLHWLNEALIEMRGLTAMPAPDLPATCFLGTEEAIVEAEPVKTRMAGWKGASLTLLEGGRHEVLMERPELRRKVLDGMLALFAAAA